MLVQTATFRPTFNMFALPENVVVMTLERSITSAGDLLVSYDPDFRESLVVPQTRRLALDVEGLAVREFVVPFNDLAGRYGRQAAEGYYFRADSAVRNGTQYEERSFRFFITFPVNGGGIVRMSDINVDFTNPFLNQRAGVPPLGSMHEELRDENRERVSDENIVIAYNRVHAGGSSAQTSRAEALRAHRVANFVLEFEQNVPTEERAVQFTESIGGYRDAARRALPTMTPRPDPLPRYMRDLGLDDE